MANSSIQQRKSYIEIGELNFWTATINNWQPLLKDDSFKIPIINSLSYLSEKNKIEVFAFVIMPNHIQLIWRTLEMNGKETPQGSFLKYTAHEFKKLLHVSNFPALQQYQVTAFNKKHEFWKRDSLAIPLFTKEVAFQKMDYMHANPVSGKWLLCTDPCDYHFSSAAFYEASINNFNFLKDIREEF